MAAAVRRGRFEAEEKVACSGGKPSQTTWRRRARGAKRLYTPRKYGRELTLVQDNTRAIRPSDVLLVTCLRNELVRLPFFLDYYRKLGVNHFLFINNDSTDDFAEWVRQHEDCSVWHTSDSYLASGFGMQWCNYLLGRYGHGHLCVTVDPDEFLVYPRMTTRKLRDLGVFLKDDERASMHALLVDAYGPGTLSETRYYSGDDPFEVCPYFDRDCYVQRPGENKSTYVLGGPRMRVHNQAPRNVASPEQASHRLVEPRLHLRQLDA